MTHRLGIRFITICAILLLPAVAHADEAAEFAKTLDKGWLWVYLASFGTGVLTSLTPCVYPMIPITVAVFGSKDDGTSRKKAFALAACYVGGMGVLFAALGTGFAMAGGQAGSLLSNPKVIIPLALLLVALATSLFGAFELRLPYALQNRLNQVGGKGYGGAFGMGLVGGLVAAPCTGPFLAGMLIWVASTGQPVIGATLLFTYALGVGVLFFFLAVTSMSIPKSGPWMEGIKNFGGIGLLGVAIHFLRPVWPLIDDLSIHATSALGSPTLLLAVGVGLCIAGVLLGSIHLSFHDKPAIKARKSLAVALTVIGVTAVVSGILVPEKQMEWRHDESVAFADAKREKKGVMIDFGATWCAPCKIIEKVFGEPEVHSKLNSDFVPLKFDVSESSDADQALQERYKASSLPAVLFLDAEGNELVRYTNKTPDAKSMLATIKEAREQLRGGAKSASR
jgi:thiol:disulfide interchange protein DsbD